LVTADQRVVGEVANPLDGGSGIDLDASIDDVVVEARAYRKLKRPIWVFEEVNLTPTYATNGIGCSRELFGAKCVEYMLP